MPRFLHPGAPSPYRCWKARRKRSVSNSAIAPLVIADYGSSQGKNSLAAMRAAIRVLRARTGGQPPILVFHTDLPGDDFSELFNVLEGDPDSYLRGDPNVFPYAIGRSFYRSVFPPGRVGWSSYAAVWLSQILRQFPGHFFIPCSDGPVRAEFDRQAVRDWEAFLALRATELRSGARLVALPALGHDGSTSLPGGRYPLPGPVFHQLDHASLAWRT